MGCRARNYFSRKHNNNKEKNTGNQKQVPKDGAWLLTLKRTLIVIILIVNQFEAISLHNGLLYISNFEVIIIPPPLCNIISTIIAGGVGSQWRRLAAYSEIKT